MHVHACISSTCMYFKYMHVFQSISKFIDIVISFNTFLLYEKVSILLQIIELPTSLKFSRSFHSFHFSHR